MCHVWRKGRKVLGEAWVWVHGGRAVWIWGENEDGARYEVVCGGVVVGWCGGGVRVVGWWWFA